LNTDKLNVLPVFGLTVLSASLPCLCLLPWTNFI